MKKYILLMLFILFSCKDDPDIVTTAEKKPFIIENLGVTIAPWNPETNLAGDIYFVSYLQKSFLEFGAKVKSYDGSIKELPTFEYVIKQDASVFAIAEGKVSWVVFQEETGDYEFAVQSQNDPDYYVIYDHVVNLLVEKDNVVFPGDFLGNPQPINEYGRFEIMINNDNTKLSYCPFVLFNDETKDEYLLKVYQLMKDWETFKGDTTIYDENEQILNGCRMESMLSY